MDTARSPREPKRPEADGPRQGSWLSIGCGSSARIDRGEALRGL